MTAKFIYKKKVKTKNLKNKIPLLSELIEQYEAGKIQPNGSVYEVYMTELHKKKKSVGWINDSEFENYSKLRDEHQKAFNAAFLWEIR